MSLSRLDLGSVQTPVEVADRLADALGLGPGDLLVKRDDLLGPGGGGNKVRKLEWTCAEALAAGADTLVTTGAAQSNHARLTAAVGARLGLRVVLVLAGRRRDDAEGNLLLDVLLGAQVVWAGDVDGPGLEAAADRVVTGLRSEGATPFLVPFGGSSPSSVRGYAAAGDELAEQVPDVRHVVVALGSGGTMAGLVSSLGVGRVLGVHCGAVPDPHAAVRRLLSDTPVAHDGLRIRTDQVGTSYGDLAEPAWQAVLLAGRTEGLVLEPTYTGRALAGLAAAVREGDVRRGERTVLVHTGGLPGLFGHQEARRRLRLGASGDGGTPLPQR
ncbi:pyridoxal-phosphate dependent enzyme [Nocardioides dongxiaopingii]|uniref:pyridoxal-phosphate dependent enzyme n=1 Tax=Nocardioides TaxID=1839 RepID=UPI0010C76C70|nr:MULTISPECIES: pyridoxal-phosphate dependent enzyme [Nocardioides]QDH10985.1 pyridoxal-phosphate dependent enzyme [Nocardioides sp. S-1144]